MFRQFSIRSGYFSSTFVNCLCGSDTLHQPLSTVHADGKLSVHYRELSVQPEELAQIFHVSGDLPSISGNILSGHDTLPKLP